MSRKSVPSRTTATPRAPKHPQQPVLAVEATAAEVIATARKAAFTSLVPAEAFAHFAPVAAKAFPEDVAPFTGQPLLLFANASEALRLIEPHLIAAVAAHREPRLREVFEISALTMALDFAAGRVPGEKLSTGEISTLLAEGSPWRELTLKYLEVVSDPLLNLVPQGRVRAVRAGTGKLDTAQDFTAIPGIFNEFAEVLAGKHPFLAEALARLAELGAILVQQIRPGNAPRATVGRSSEALARDQIAALVVERYDHLLVLAAVALGRAKADALLPALRSSVVAQEPAPKPAPPVPPVG